MSPSNSLAVFVTMVCAESYLSSKELGVITVQVEAEGLEGTQTEIRVSSDVRASEVYSSKDEMDSPAGLHISS